MHSLGQLFHARQLAKDPDVGDRVDVKKVDAEIEKLWSGDLKGKIADMEKRAKADVLGSYDPGSRQADYIKSDAYRQRLSLVEPKAA